MGTIFTPFCRKKGNKNCSIYFTISAQLLCLYSSLFCSWVVSVLCCHSMYFIKISLVDNGNLCRIFHNFLPLAHVCVRENACVYMCLGPFNLRNTYPQQSRFNIFCVAFMSRFHLVLLREMVCIT